MVFLPRASFQQQEACRTIVESEVLGFGYAIRGWRQVPVDTSVLGEKAAATRPEIEQIIIGNPKGRRRGAVRARPLPDPPPDREAGAGREHHRVLHLLAQLPLGDLQGPVPRRVAGRLLPRPAGRALRLELRAVPPALLDQHHAVLEAGPAVPHARPQWRDQHPARQRQLDEEPRDADGRRRVRRAQRGRQADHPARQLRQRRPRRGLRGPGPRRPPAAAGQDHADPAGLVAPHGDQARAPRPVQLLQLRHGAVGRPGRHRRHRFALGRGRPGPQRPAARCATRAPATACWWSAPRPAWCRWSTTT